VVVCCDDVTHGYAVGVLVLDDFFMSSRQSLATRDPTKQCLAMWSGMYIHRNKSPGVAGG
jgi:hypothetical protein